MTKNEQLQRNAYAWMNKQIKADKMMRKSFQPNIKNIRPDFRKSIHMAGLALLSEITGIAYKKSPFDEEYDRISLYYNDYEFFELIDKE